MSPLSSAPVSPPVHAHQSVSAHRTLRPTLMQRPVLLLTLAMLAILLTMGVLGSLLWCATQAQATTTLHQASTLPALHAAALVAPDTAHSTNNRPVTFPPLGTCLGQTCLSQDPIALNCVLDAHTRTATPIIYHGPPFSISATGQQVSAGMVVGLLELRFSQACGAVWGRITGLPGTTVVVNLNEQPNVSTTSSPSYPQAYTDMSPDLAGNVVYGTLWLGPVAASPAAGATITA